MNKNKELIQEILEDIRHDMSDEEVLQLLLESKVAEKTHLKKEGFAERASDAIACFAGSWTFILIFLGVLVSWMLLNAYWMTHRFDPYPFILLNLVLSCVAALQAPLILMSQNRQEEKDRTRAINDYKVNLKAEIVLEDMHHKINRLVKDQHLLQTELEALKKNGH